MLVEVEWTYLEASHGHVDQLRHVGHFGESAAVVGWLAV